MRLARLEPLRTKPKSEFAGDPYLRDIVERNLEIAARCCIDLGNRIVALEGAAKPRDYYEAITRLGELGVITPDLALRVAPIAGLRNVLIHQYTSIDWDQVYASLQRLDDLAQTAEQVRAWLLTTSQHPRSPCVYRN